MFLHILDIESGLCNLRCEYCFLTLGGIKETVRKDNDLYSKSNDGSLVYDYSINYLATRTEYLLQAIDASVLEVLGGELFLLPEVLDLLVKRSDKYSLIRIITNGTILKNYDLRKMDPSKFSFQVSLDGKDMTGNQFRFKSEHAHLNNVLDNIKTLYERNYIVEINCVLTEKNIARFKDFAIFIKNQYPGVLIYPYPVRFFSKEHYVKPSRIGLIGSWTQEKNLSQVLPPDPYIQEMIKAINGQKESRCYLPLIAVSGSEDGSINLCPCAMLKVLGNIFENGTDFLNQTLNKKEVQNVLEFKYSVCRKCFTHFDIVNLFIEGLVSENDLVDKGMFRNISVLEALIKEKEKLIKEAIR